MEESEGVKTDRGEMRRGEGRRRREKGFVQKEGD